MPCCSQHVPRLRPIAEEAGAEAEVKAAVEAVGEAVVVEAVVAVEEAAVAG